MQPITDQEQAGGFSAAEVELKQCFHLWLCGASSSMFSFDSERKFHRCGINVTVSISQYFIGFLLTINGSEQEANLILLLWDCSLTCNV